ncbi:MAG: site-specific integrase [Planctomycetaceae bacterium]|nr:site-specific integrase [Planctomycetaceae bacterium]
MSIKVRVFKRSDRKYYEAQWVDPITGRKKTRSTKKTSQRDADRFAAKLEDELINGPDLDPAKIKWSDFRSRYESEYASTLAEKTQQKIGTAFNSFEELVSPAWLATVSSNVISKYAGRLRAQDLSEATIKGYLSQLRAAFSWAHRVGLMNSVPHFEMPKRVNKSKGRALTAEEFDRMVDATAKTVGEEYSARWTRFLRGLWWSGLRLGEAIALSWDNDEEIMVDLSGGRPMFRIRAEAEKAKKDRYLPMAPEFAELLEQTPSKARRGYVFPLMETRTLKPSGRVKVYAASKVICDIGAEAGVIVGKKRSGDPKFASAHDLRRAFGYRWGMRVLPPVLMELMRHESITTTMEYYVGRNAEAAADAVWRAFGESVHDSTNTFANTNDSEGQVVPD